MAEDKGSKTEKPTSKRRSEARRKGQVSKSMELNTFGVLLTGLFVLFFAGSFMYGQLTSMMVDVCSNSAQISSEGSDLLAFLIDKVKLMAVILSPLLLVIFIMAIFVNIIQVGVNFTPEPLMPKLSKIDPIKGFAKLFSLRSLVELFKSIAKIIIIAVTSYLIISGEMTHIVRLGDMAPIQIGYYVLKISFEIFLKTCWIFAIVAILDFAFQKWQHEQDLMMTKDEIKEELKQTEGDPLVRARIRSIQREMSRKRMMAKVPQADVVVTNPTHLAVALVYSPDQAAAPVVVAKGRALVAEKIKEIAKKHNVPLVEDKPLARALFKHCEVNDAIPYALYQAVAEILAYVYRLKGKNIHGGSGQ